MNSYKILGIDLGTNSLGWSVLQSTDDKFKKLKLFDKGVVLFDEGVILEKGNEKSKASERTGYRAARRLIFRRKLRKYNTLKVLARHNMTPLSIDEVEQWRSSNFSRYPKNKEFINWLRTDDKINKNPYYLRAKAVHEKLNDWELGRAFYHLAQRRGFLSNRLEKNKNKNEKGQVKESIAFITKQIEKAGAKSLGEYFWQLYQQDRHDENNKIRKQYLGRKEHYLQEFESICKVQELPDELCKSLKKAIFYQRPLKSQKAVVGNCVFEPRKPRMPISHPLFETFRMWSFINNIKIQTPYDEDMRFLTEEEKHKIIPLFENAPSKKSFKFADIANKLVLTEHKKAKTAYYKSKKAEKAHYLFNFDLKQTVSSSPVTALFKKYLGEDWNTKIYSYTVARPNGEKINKTADFHDIWHVMFTFDDEEKLRDYFENKLKLAPETTDKLVEYNLPAGYASLSFKAVSKILPFLKEGFTYDKAVLLAKIPEILGSEIWYVAENKNKIINKINQIFEKKSTRQKIIAAVNSTIYQIHKEQINEPIAYESFLRENMEKNFGKKTFQKLIETEGVLQTATNLLEKRLQYQSIEQQIIKQETIEQQLKNYLKTEFNVSDKDLNKLYHPSMMDKYTRQPTAADGKRYLGSPIIDSIKNPVMMRSMHLLRKLVNTLLTKGIVDNETVVHIELARDLNDANKRAAIRKYQQEREKENKNYESEIKEIFHKNGINRNVSKDDIKRYRLWKEQNEISIYTGNTISLHELFDGSKYDIEHTVPRSQSYDNSLANLTITESRINREIKRNKLASELENFDEIKLRLEPWIKNVENLQNKINQLKNKTKSAVTKEERDKLIQNRHYLNLKKEYWEKKIQNFTITEITNSFKYSQLNDTRLITKYARAYLKSVFDKVHVVNGSMVALYRKVWGLQDENEEKSRANHIHHALDATVIAAMTRHVYNKLAEAWHSLENNKIKEGKQLIRETKPWDTFTEDIMNLHKNTLIYHDFRDILPKHAKKKIRNRSTIQYRKVEQLPKDILKLIEKGVYKEGINYRVTIQNGKKIYEIPMFAQGDTARGVLHRETYYGAIAQKDEYGKIIKDKEGKIKVDYVKRIYVDDINKTDDADKIVDPAIRTIVKRDIQKRNEINEKLKNINEQLKKTTEDKEKELLEEKNKLEKEKNNLFKLPTKKGGYIPIKKVRIKTRVKQPLPNFKKHRDLSAQEYKQWYYVENEENYAMAFYEGVNNKGKIVREFEMVKNIEAAHYFKRSQQEYRKEHTLVPEQKNNLPLKYILKKGMSVLFYKENPNELLDLTTEELTKRLYIITQLGSQVYFIPHQLGGKMTELKKSAVYSPDLSGKRIMALTKGNWNFIVNNVDFTISIDGKIHFNIIKD